MALSADGAKVRSSDLAPSETLRLLRTILARSIYTTCSEQRPLNRFNTALLHSLGRKTAFEHLRYDHTDRALAHRENVENGV
jgi:hypothetical protein